MDDEQLAKVIGGNITKLRRAANMTQLDLAEKLNYSDKSVSKWEQGNGIPDVRILMQISRLFGVTLDELTSETPHAVLPKKTKFWQRIVIIALSAGLVWLVAVMCYVLIWIFAPTLPSFSWLAFLYAVPISATVILILACMWHYKWLRLIAVSVIVWTTLACVYLTAYAFGKNIWIVFLIGVPLQALAVVFFLFWKKIKFFKN